MSSLIFTSIGEPIPVKMTLNGAVHRVLKNFPSEKELDRVIEGIGTKASFRELEHFWIFMYKTV